MIVNRVDVEKFRETIEKARKDPSTGKKVVELEGQWRLGKTGPQFESRIKTENGGEITLFSDKRLILNGGGTAPNPFQYFIYGLIACYADTFAKWASMEGIMNPEILRTARKLLEVNMGGEPGESVLIATDTSTLHFVTHSFFDAASVMGASNAHRNASSKPLRHRASKSHFGGDEEC